MPRELKDAHITHVSYVDKGANKKRFFLSKAAEKQQEPTFRKEVKAIVAKEDNDQQLVYGVVYEPDEYDSHEDMMSAPEIEKAAHFFMQEARNIDTQHDFESGVGEVVESYIAPADLEIGGETIAKGSWVLVTKASDEIWEQIKKGEITGYSMAGTAEAIEKQAKEGPTQPDNGKNETGLFNLLKGFFTGEQVQKGEVREKYEADRRQREFWAAQSALDSAIFKWGHHWDDDRPESDPEKVRDALQDFVDIATEVLTRSTDVQKAIGEPPTEIAKAGRKVSAGNMKKINAALEALQELKNEVEGEEDDVKKEELEKALQTVVDPIIKRLDAIEKGEGDGGGTNQITEQDQVLAMLQKAVEPLEGRISAMEKSRGASQQREQDPNSGNTHVAKGYMSNFM
ncbi:XkdF-like putative serine protease domain-containing protein [Aureibacillus halotolerans]|uniref:Putative serine protease XkdF n=1 Tax=Aureibacillus halotolerans TaxID=1508390 RepID=A0A4R6TUE8_9BACI|nr:XkdF-like putative serine protease domain-containing protein [Aureibacillus halotolerans]TDQ35274.1 putative serine protease XkdF [Aureibacillus halotolerans]